jgi:hypothetical protein
MSFARTRISVRGFPAHTLNQPQPRICHCYDNEWRQPGVVRMLLSDGFISASVTLGRTEEENEENWSQNSAIGWTGGVTWFNGQG